jgi:hypothetical protein
MNAILDQHVAEDGGQGIRRNVAVSQEFKN